MKLLAFDCSTGACSCATTEKGQVKARSFTVIERGHNETLCLMIRDTLAACQWQPRDLDAYAVTLGPGSFTGIRIGLATGKALALATEKPLIGLSSLAVLAWPVFSQAPARPEWGVCCLPAREGSFYTQIFKASDSRVGYLPASPITIRPTGQNHDWIPANAWVTGIIPPAFRAALTPRKDLVFHQNPETRGYPDSEALGRLATAEYTGKPLPHLMPRPLYVRPHYAEKQQISPHSQKPT